MKILLISLETLEHLYKTGIDTSSFIWKQMYI